MVARRISARRKESGRFCERLVVVHSTVQEANWDYSTPRSNSGSRWLVGVGYS